MPDKSIEERLAAIEETLEQITSPEVLPEESTAHEPVFPFDDSNHMGHGG